MSPKICECGCGASVANRFKSGHNRRGYVSSTEEITNDFWFTVSVESSGCWSWTGRRVKGYGQYAKGGRRRGGTYIAHRLSYQQIRGAIPDGLMLDHLCRNRACINPDHLEPVTCRENILRGEGRAAVNAARTECVNGHEFTPENTRVYFSDRWPNGKRICRACGRINGKRHLDKKAATS